VPRVSGDLSFWLGRATTDVYPARFLWDGPKRLGALQGQLYFLEVYSGHSCRFFAMGVRQPFEMRRGYVHVVANCFPVDVNDEVRKLPAGLENVVLFLYVEFAFV
jgi:hypothetical protein